MAEKKKREGRDTQWVEGLEGYSRQIWLAGLGAYTRMGKEGAKLFESLIKDGEQAEQSAKAEAGSTEGKGKKKDPLEGARAKVDKARSKLTDKFGGLEEMFDKRVAGAVERLGLARQEELQALADQVTALRRTVEQLSAKPAAAAKPARSRQPAPATATTASTAVIAESLAQAASEAAAEPAAKGRAKRTPEAKASTAPAKTTTRRRATAPKAATRGTTGPAPATDAAPGKPSEQ